MRRSLRNFALLALLVFVLLGCKLLPAVLSDPIQVGTVTPTVLEQVAASAPAVLLTPIVIVSPTPAQSRYTNHVLQVSFDYPAHWNYVEGDEAGEKYAAQDGFFRTGGMSGGGMDLEQVAQSEAHHVLRPFGTQPTIKSFELQGQPACLILPSADQLETSPDFAGMAELIVQYPQPFMVNDSPVEFFVLYADQAHIRSIAGSLAFQLSPDSQPPAADQNLLAGLVYINMLTAETWQIGGDGQHHLQFASIIANISPDGSKAIDEQDHDLWLVDLQTGERRQLTDTPDRVEWQAQWWPTNPGMLVFSSRAQSDWLPFGPGQLSAVDLDGSYSLLSEVPSIGFPSLNPDGVTIAFDQDGAPRLYRLGEGIRTFDPAGFGFPASGNQRFFNPSWSPDGDRLSWWVASGVPAGGYELVMFEFSTRSHYLIAAYNPPASTTWLPLAPVWSYDGQWLAYQTMDEVSPKDLYILRQDGSQSHRYGLASDPLWSPDGNRLVFIQSPPRTANLAASAFLVDTTSWQPIPAGLPDGSLPISWLDAGPRNETSALQLPMFTPPEGWLEYTDSELGFAFDYPPDASLLNENGALNINFAINPGTDLQVKAITIDVRPVVEETCYGGLEWQGVFPVNGADFRFYQGEMWEQAMGGLSFFRADFAAFHRDFCYRIAFRMGKRDDPVTSQGTLLPTPNRADLDIEIFLDVLSTFKITR